MADLLLFNKPYKVLSQFGQPAGTVPGQERHTLASFIHRKGFYPAGRLDYHSEGLLLLTDDGALQARIAAPASRTFKHYWVQVEGACSAAALQALRDGVELRDGRTLPARVEAIAPPESLWAREPPVLPARAARSSWLDIAIYEGRNRQVRRMCAAVGLPVLRLVRYRIGHWHLAGLQPGDTRAEQVHLPVQAGESNKRGPEHARQRAGTAGKTGKKDTKRPRRR